VSDRKPMINVKGYASPRQFSGFQIPIPLQSMTIRRYCEDRGFRFNHHVVENITPNTFLVLERVVEEIHQYQAVGMCSIGLLPPDTEYRTRLVRACIDAGVSVHFVFEQLVLSRKSDIETLNELMTLTSLSKIGSDRAQIINAMVNYPSAQDN
jgi:sporadic carbohydrate cluster protein (TIGR04323 family)